MLMRKLYTNNIRDDISASVSILNNAKSDATRLFANINEAKC